jgi:hypothetical protein
MGFVQIIEFRTQRLEEFRSLEEDWVKRTEGKRTLQRLTLCRDRDRGDVYVQVAEFPSYEDAMRNSELPETSEAADRLAKLCDEPPTFRNLDVIDSSEF